MELLICIINRQDHVEEILSGFLKLGVTGATLIDSEGMGRVLSGEMPVFGGLQEVLAHRRPESKTIMSVIESPTLLDSAIKLVQDVCGDLYEPSTGILFTVPVNRVIGLAARLDLPPDSDAKRSPSAGTD